MTPVPATVNQPEAPLFTDGLGDRVVAVDAATGDLLQILRVRPQLLAVPSFEFALRERAARLANFRHAYYARVRRIDRHPSGLAIVSDHVEGVRLSDMLRVAYERNLQIDLNAALCLLRQVVPSIALLHENARDVAHGLLAPERLIVTPRARVIVVEHVLGSAVEQLQFNRERLWQELRVSVPVSVGAPRFDHRADVMAIGLTALALVLGRPLADHEYPQRIGALLNEAKARTAGSSDQPLPDALHNWIARALQLDVRQGFQSATEAQVALEDALADDSEFVPAPVALEAFLSRYSAVMLEPAPAPYLSAPMPIAIVPPSVATPSAATPSAATPAPVVPAPVSVVMPPPAPVVVPAPPSAATAAFHQPVTSPEPPKPSPRDITDLLRDFDLPPVAAPAAPAHAHGHEARREPAAPAAEVKKGPRFSMPGGGAPMGRIALIVGALAVLGGGGYYAAKVLRKPPPPKLGTLSMQTNPPGVAVFVDGVAQGNTPARISLEAGPHTVELRGSGVPRVFNVPITAGAETSNYIEFKETPSSGSLLVQSDPAGARVSVDGVDHGVAPVSVPDLAPGDHEVVLQAAGGPPVTQRVLIQAGVTSSVLAPVSTATPGPVSGWLTVKSPVAIEIRENGRLIGTTEADRIMMAAGKHDLELVNDTLGYRATRSVQVPPGKVAPLTLEMPQGVISVNAAPWAEVWIDGRRAGETPMANLPIAIGPHEIVFRHPQLGEKRQAVSVTLKAPVRLSQDMK
jgi:PEGA domain